MTTTVTTPAPAPLENTQRRTATWNRPLMICVGVMVLLAVATGIGVLTDPRVLTGAPIWLKPFKFAVSIAIYAFSIAWLMSLLPRRGRLTDLVAWILVATLGLEMVLMVMQVFRGTTSHFNVATPFDSAVFNAMAGLISMAFLAHLVLGIVVLRRRIADRAAAVAIRLGLLITAVGMAAAMPMVLPSGDPLRDNLGGAHTVGLPDGGPGLPVVGWSTVGGDYRIGHFIGLHGLQALPLLAFALAALSRRVRALDEKARIGLLVVAGAAYTVLTVSLTWQASRGQALLHPDAATLTVWVALAAGVAPAATVVLAGGRRRAVTA